MRTVFFSTIGHYPWGGADALWTAAAARALDRGDSILLVVNPSVSRHQSVDALVRRGAALVTWRPTHLPPLWLRLGRRLLNRTDEDLVLAAIRDFEPERVFLNQGGPYDFVMFPRLLGWLRTAAVPYHIIVNWQQENPWASFAATEQARDAMEAAAAVWFLSERNLNITRMHLRTDLPRGAVAQPPIRSPAGLSGNPRPAGTTLRLATVGRLDPVKGLHLLISALAELPVDLPAWRLTIHGLGPEEADLRALSTWLGMADRVDFAGFQTDLSAIWSLHDLLVSPALDEGIPLTIPEAMLHGRPVLATRVGGASEWITPGVSGYLCAPGSVPPLAEALTVALCDSPQWPALGARARDGALARLRPEDASRLIA